MQTLIKIPTHIDHRGNLSVIERILPFDIKRVYYIYSVTLPRGNHMHKYSSTFLICLCGIVKVKLVKNNQTAINVELKSPEVGLLISPLEWIELEFSNDAILLCLSSHEYDNDDYIFQKP